MTSRSAIAWSPCVLRHHFPSIRSWEAPRDCLAASRAPLRPWSHRAHATFAWAVEREDLGERRSRWHGGRVKATTAMVRTRVRQTMERLHLLGKTKEHLPYTACARRQVLLSKKWVARRQRTLQESRYRCNWSRNDKFGVCISL